MREPSLTSWATGIIDAKGTFGISFYIFKTDNRILINPFFQLTDKDRQLVEKLKTILGFGNLGKIKDNQHIFRIGSLDGNKRLIDFLEGRLQLNETIERFNLWKEVIEMKSKGTQFEEANLKRIIEIRKQLHKLGSGSGRKRINPLTEAIIRNKIIPNAELRKKRYSGWMKAQKKNYKTPLPQHP